MVAGDDEVVEDLHVHERQSFFEATCEQLIGLARLRGAGRMVMSEDHGGGVGSERRLHNFPRVDAGLRQCAAERLVEFDDAVLHIKPDAHEDLVQLSSQGKPQVIAHCPGRIQGRP